MRKFPRHDPMPRLHLSYHSGILKDFAEWNPERNPDQVGWAPIYHVTKGVLSLRDCYPTHVKILEPRTHEAKQPTLHLLGMEMISTRVPPRDLNFFSVRGELHRSPGQIEWTRSLYISEEQILKKLGISESVLLSLFRYCVIIHVSISSLPY